MKILCVSDQVDPAVYSTSIKQRFGDVDLVLSAGDLPMEYLGFIVSCLNKPLLFVFGNHNLGELAYYARTSYGSPELLLEQASGAYSSGAIHVGFKAVREAGLLVAGLGGSIRYNDGENQFTDREMFFKILRLAPRLFMNKLLYGRYLDILLTHAPPLGIHDKSDPCHRGFKAFRWFIRRFKPRYLVHGHIHLYDLNEARTSDYEGTRVVNAFSHYIIDWEE
jgi:calcineurin-like phosphoesterase family protein